MFKLAFYVLVPVVLIVLPADYFDGGESLCLSMILFDMECYACGMTRAMMRIIHFDFAGAYFYNAISLVAFPLLAGLWAKWFWDEWKRFRKL